MKTLLMLLSFLCVMTSSAVITKEEFSELSKKQNKSPEEVEKWKEYVASVMMGKNGGIVEKANSQKGKVVIANAQTLVPNAEIKGVIAQFSRIFRINVESIVVSDISFSAFDAQKKFGANAVVAVADYGEQPSLCYMPDYNFAMINITALKKGAADSKIVTTRLRKEVVRAFAYVCGAAASIRPDTLMGPIQGIEGLDALNQEFIPIDVVQRIQKNLPRIGVVPAISATYRKACGEGWAPAPTNEYQKAIWDEVHAIPAQPMKIEFDPKKGR